MSMLPSLSSSVTRPPFLVSISSPGLTTAPRTKLDGEWAFPEMTAGPLTLATRASTTATCAFTPACNRCRAIANPSSRRKHKRRDWSGKHDRALRALLWPGSFDFVIIVGARVFFGHCKQVVPGNQSLNRPAIEPQHCSSATPIASDFRQYEFKITTL